MRNEQTNKHKTTNAESPKNLTIYSWTLHQEKQWRPHPAVLSICTSTRTTYERTGEDYLPAAHCQDRLWQCVGWRESVTWGHGRQRYLAQIRESRLPFLQQRWNRPREGNVLITQQKIASVISRLQVKLAKMRAPIISAATIYLQNSRWKKLKISSLNINPMYPK